MNVDDSSIAAPPASASAEDAMDVDMPGSMSAPDNKGDEVISDDEIETVQ